MHNGGNDWKKVQYEAKADQTLHKSKISLRNIGASKHMQTSSKEKIGNHCSTQEREFRSASEKLSTLNFTYNKGGRGEVFSSGNRERDAIKEKKTSESSKSEYSSSDYIRYLQSKSKQGSETNNEYRLKVEDSLCRVS
jgi:undecaprenyl pyrophosphate synthase